MSCLPIRGKDIVTGKRKVIKLRTSYAIILPKEWVDKHGIKEGDMVFFVANDTVHVFPKEHVNLEVVALPSPEEDDEGPSEG